MAINLANFNPIGGKKCEETDRWASTLFYEIVSQRFPKIMKKKALPDFGNFSSKIFHSLHSPALSARFEAAFKIPPRALPVTTRILALLYSATVTLLLRIQYSIPTLRTIV